MREVASRNEVASRHTFSNAPVTSEPLIPGKPGYAGDAIMHVVNLWNDWSTLTEVLRMGASVLRREGEAREDWVVPFIFAMHANARLQVPQSVPLVSMWGGPRLPDV